MPEPAAAYSVTIWLGGYLSLNPLGMTFTEQLQF